MHSWQMEDKHERKLIEHVKLKQTIRALTLLTEGYPIAETEGYRRSGLGSEREM